MNKYSAALRHIDIKDVKQKHQHKLIEQKNKEEKQKEEEKYIASVMEEKKYDWRGELNEQMTTSNVFFTTLPAVGDVDLDDGTWGPPASGGWNDSISGNTVTLSGDPSPYIGNSTIRSITGSDEYDTLVIDVTSNGTPYYIDNGNPPYVSYGSGSSSRRFVIPFSKRLPLILFTDGGGTVTFTPKLQRRSPKNVFVPLSSPEASSFVRTDPAFAGLSEEEKKQKLKEMLEASDEYVTKALGLDFPGTGSVPPGEYDPFAQAPPGQFGDTPGVEIAGYGLRPDGTSGMNKVGDKVYDPATKKEYQLVPSTKYGGGTQWTPVKQAGKASIPMVASYEPKGKLISEKKKKYDWREELQKDRKRYFIEGMTTSDVFYTNLPSEGSVDLVSSDVSINFSGGTPGEVGSPSEGFYARSQIIGPVDTTRYDTIGITVTVNSSINFGEGLILTSVGGLSGATVILSPGSTSGTYYAKLPFTSSASSYRLIQVVSNTGSSTFTINKISYQRRSPKNVFISLDSPEATSFIRTGSGDLSPEEKLQKLKDMLKAGDEYVQQIHGDEFPGTGAVPPGESGDIPGVQTIDYGEIAQYTDDPSTWPSIKNPVKTPPPIIDPKTGWPSVPNVPPSYRGKPGGQPVRLAHYKPKGRLISEKTTKIRA